MVYSQSNARGGRLSLWLILAAGLAGAQVYPGGYPGGGYPGGGYPYPGGGYPGGGYPDGGTGIPIPGRRSKQPKTDPNQPLPNFRGKLQHMDEKTISLTLGDDRVLDFHRTGKTKFYKDGKEIKSPKFTAGDQISVEGPEEADGTMTAVNVYWEKAAPTTPTATADSAQSPKHSPEKDKSEGVPDTWAKDAPANSKPSAEAAPPDDPDRPVLKRAPSAQSSAPAPASPPASAAAPAPAQPQTVADAAPPRDPDAPILRRGRPADPARQRSGPVPYQANPPATPPLGPEHPEEPVATASASPDNPPVLRRAGDDDAAPPGRRPIDETDQLIRRATDAALDFTESLPAYVCQEMMSRYQSESQPAHFMPLDILSMNLVYENGKEHYRDLAINGKHTDKTLQESGGAWSTGEFGTVLIDLFAPATGADFQFQHDDRIAGIPAKLYKFDVKRENSHWDVHAMSQSYSPAYHGSVWIDPQNARVLRIEMQAYQIPTGFPLDTVESATDYSYVRLGDAKQYLLPVHAENLSCQRGTPYCSKIVIDFRNYHKYQGESTITFGPTEKK